MDNPVLSVSYLFRRLSTINAKRPLAKYSKQRGIANKVMVIGSGVGVKAAVNTKQRNTARRHGFRIAFPDKTPRRLSATRNSGKTNAIPKIRINLKTKSRYSSNRIRFPRLFGVKPSKTLTACGRIKYAKYAPEENKGVATAANKIVIRRSFLCKAGVTNAHI